MHHVAQGECETVSCAMPLWLRTLENFDAHTACDGTIYLEDHPCLAPQEYYPDDRVTAGARACSNYSSELGL